MLVTSFGRLAQSGWSVWEEVLGALRTLSRNIASEQPSCGPAVVGMPKILGCTAVSEPYPERLGVVRRGGVRPRRAGGGQLAGPLCCPACPGRLSHRPTNDGGRPRAAINCGWLAWSRFAPPATCPDRPRQVRRSPPARLSAGRRRPRPHNSQCP